jgi:hypothetical protein
MLHRRAFATGAKLTAPMAEMLSIGNAIEQ